MNSSKVSNNMFCGFCKNKGKEYKSHDLKGKDGIIICKEILSTECRFCHKLGHTKKFCTVLQEKIERENNVSFPLNVNEKEKEKKSIVAIEERLKNKNKEKTEAKQAYELNQRQKKQAFETRQAIRVQKKKDQRGLFVCDMTRLLGYRWFIHIKKHLKMEDLIKTYNLHTEDELHNIRREYKYEEEEELKYINRIIILTKFLFFQELFSFVFLSERQKSRIKFLFESSYIRMNVYAISPKNIITQKTSSCWVIRF